jgi:hypothetical protein
LRKSSAYPQQLWQLRSRRAAAAEAVEEKTEFDVIMTSFGSRRTSHQGSPGITGQGLAEAKATVEAFLPRSRKASPRMRQSPSRRSSQQSAHSRNQVSYFFKIEILHPKGWSIFCGNYCVFIRLLM